MDIPVSALTSHIMLSSEYINSHPSFDRAEGGGEHRRTPSTASSLSSSSLSSSYDFAASRSEGSYGYSAPDSLEPGGVLTRSSTRIHESPTAQISSFHGNPPQLHHHHQLQQPQFPYTASPSSAPAKRTPSIRHSRADSAPYPSSTSSASSISEDEDDWPSSSRRSSTSSAGWSSYDPAANSSQEFSFDFSMINTPKNAGGIRGSEDGRAVEETKLVLERCASSVRNAVTASTQDRARGAFVQAWLGHSYQPFEEGNVSRQGLYGSYQKSCSTYGVKAINSASFGKAVRQKFPDIKTRRLGVRGASRYHYCGIRPANSLEMSILAEFAREEGSVSTSSTSVDGEGSPVDGGEGWDEEGPGVDRVMGSVLPSGQPSSLFAEAQPLTPTTARPKNPDAPYQQQQQRHLHNHHHTISDVARPDPLQSRKQPQQSSVQFQPPPQGNTAPQKRNRRTLSITVPKSINLGDGERTLRGSLADFPRSEELGTDARPFWSLFSKHCHMLLENVRSFRFDQFEYNIRTWWTSLDPQQRAIAQHPTVAHLIYKADAAVYADILEFLHTQILVSMSPQSFAALGALADHMEKIQTVALVGFEGTAFPGPKVELAARFGHLITRHLGLCQLTQALAGIVTNPSNLHDMAAAWDLIDFDAIKNQSALVSNCEHELLTVCFNGFRHLLRNPGPVPIESFVRWVEQSFERCMSPTMGSRMQASPRSLLIRWSFVTSQIMRDLTLRSAPTFGSFAIASTFCDEFLSFQVLRRVALKNSAIAAATGTASALGSGPIYDSPLETHSPMSLSLENTAKAHQGQPAVTHYTLEPTPSFNIYEESHSSFKLAEGGPVHAPILNTTNHPYEQQFADSAAPSTSLGPMATPPDPHMSSPLDFSSFGYDLGSSISASGVPTSADHMHFNMMDIERFGDLRFDSSPSASASPAGYEVPTPASTAN